MKNWSINLRWHEITAVRYAMQTQLCHLKMRPMKKIKKKSNEFDEHQSSVQTHHFGLMLAVFK